MASLLIKTPTGQEVIIDGDLDLPGSVSMSGNGYPQVCPKGSGKSIPLHQYIMGTAGRGFEVIVDHVNRNKLDNRRENLRLVSPHDSNINRKDRARKYDLPAHVYPTRSGRFAVRITRHGERRNLGTYGTIEEAARIVEDFKKEYDINAFRRVQ
jgi:hypothetical protein